MSESPRDISPWLYISAVLNPGALLSNRECYEFCQISFEKQACADNHETTATCSNDDKGPELSFNR